MSLMQDLTSFLSKTLTLEVRVDINTENIQSNAEDIKALRQDLKELTQFTQQVAFAVKRYRADMNHAQERIDDKHTLFVKTIENELNKFSARNNSAAIAPELNGGQNRLPESRDDSQD